MSLKQIVVKSNSGTCWEISQEIIYEKITSILFWIERKKNKLISQKETNTTNQIVSALICSWLLECQSKCFKAHYNCNLGKPSTQPAGEL